MHTLEELEQGWAAAAPAPRDQGRVRTICLRKGDGVHDTVESVELTLAGGALGDRWAAGETPKRHSQLTMIRTTVADLIAHEGRASHHSGDNFQVDLDLSEENLPPGTRLSIGTAIIAITDEPHLGCAKFSARFGAGAHRWVAIKENRPLRLRGVHCEVIAPGVVRAGDAIAVLR